MPELSRNMGKWTELFLGTLLILASLLIFFLSETWKAAAISLLKGSLFWFFLLMGITFIVLSIIELRE
ncbi:MAG: hypothetical protein MUF61_03220 [archaeon]|nr:hypothetical protein [archaeon]